MSDIELHDVPSESTHAVVSSAELELFSVASQRWRKRPRLDRISEPCALAGQDESDQSDRQCWVNARFGIGGLQ